MSVLQNRNYRMWLIGLSGANVGTWMQRIAQDWLVLELTDRSGTALGLVTALQFLPILLVGTTGGGVIADRYDRRHTLLWTQVVVGLCAAALAVLVLTHTIALWHVMVVAVVLGLASAVFQPTVQAFVLELVERDQLTTVVGISGGSFHVARLVGPAVAGALIAASGTGPVFVIAAVTVAGPIVALLRMDVNRLHLTPRTGGGRGMFREGLRYVRGDRDILLLLAVTGFVGTFAANSAVTNALMATTVFDRGAREFGLLGSVLAIGSLGGAALAARRKRVSTRFVVWVAIGFCVCNMLSGLMPTYAGFAVSLVAVGLSQLTFITAANSALQLRADDRLRGRVMALFTVLMTGTTPIGAPLLGWLAERADARVALELMSAAGLVGVLVSAAIHYRRSPAAVPAETERDLVGER
ncbi:MFS transporter [Actinoplanes sp. NBRC 14428]|nr:MFS transporter [Actinoplanes sp. NBRC 14428]